MKTIYSLILIIIATILWGQANTTYTYDDLNRLTEIQYHNGNKTVYEYDVLGNRISKQIITNASDYYLSDLEGPLITSYDQALNVVLNANYSGTFTQEQLDEVEIAFYLSADCEWSEDDIMLTNSTANLGYDLPAEVVNTEVLIQNTIAEGTYTMLVFIDYNNAVEEMDEENNIVCSELTITSENIYYADLDGDGFGDNNNFMTGATQPEGYVLDNTDCDDTNANINPEAIDIANNGIDENCDGVDGSTGNNDSDGDGIADNVDNCPNTANPNQEDGNGDGVGDHCEACDLPYMVELTRTGDTTATFDAGNSVWHYQGTANRAGRPLRPYPMYGMGDMTVVHTQYNLVPAFDYSVWLRTICGNGMYSDWAGPFYLPTYNTGVAKLMTLSPNPATIMVKIDKVDAKLVEVYDMYGSFIKSVIPIDNTLSVVDLSAGRYSIKVIDTDGKEHYGHIIKK